jgi:hypothetical protein
MIDSERESPDIAIEPRLVANCRSMSTVCTAIGAVVADVVFPAHRSMPALVGQVALLCLNEGRLSILGLKAASIEGRAYRCRTAIRMGVFIAVTLAEFAGIALVPGWSISAHRIDPDRFLLAIHSIGNLAALGSQFAAWC